MPGCSENFDSEIENGKNRRTIKCKYCFSVILTPTSATFTSFEADLPIMQQNIDNDGNPEMEKMSLFWEVKDMFTFQNVGFSNTVGNEKYLTCADCDAGPIGYYDMLTKISYVALTRVLHVNPVEINV